MSLAAKIREEIARIEGEMDQLKAMLKHKSAARHIGPPVTARHCAASAAILRDAALRTTPQNVRGACSLATRSGLMVRRI